MQDPPHERIDAALDAHRRRLTQLAVALLAAVAAAVVVTKTTDWLPGVPGLAPWDVRPTLPAVVRAAIDAVLVLCTPAVAAATVLGLAAVAWWRSGPRLALVAPAAAAVVALTTVVKHAGTDTSLPSGHAAYAAAVLGFAGWLALREGRRWLAAALWTLPPAIAAARVVEGAHWPPDVLAGLALGAGWLLVLLLAERATARP